MDQPQITEREYLTTTEEFKLQHSFKLQPREFIKSYRKANCLSKFFYSYTRPLINKVRKNNYEMKEEYLEDMTLKDDETDIDALRF